MCLKVAGMSSTFHIITKKIFSKHFWHLAVFQDFFQKNFCILISYVGQHWYYGALKSPKSQNVAVGQEDPPLKKKILGQNDLDPPKVFENFGQIILSEKCLIGKFLSKKFG